MKSLISVLILTYNRSDLLIQCLKSALNSNYPNLELIIADNGSSEDISSIVKKKFPKLAIKVVKLEKNKGLTGGFNFGFKHCHGEYVMILSNDTKVFPKTISSLAQVLDNDRSVGIASPKILQMLKPDKLHNVGSFFTFTGMLYHYGLNKNANKSSYNIPYYIFSCNGAGFLIRKKSVEKTGLFDEDFFVYYDESDLCHRIWLAGYTIVYCPQAVLKHLWGTTINTADPNVWFLNDRNKISSFIKNLSFPYLVVVLIDFNLILFAWFFINLFKGQFKIAFNLPRVYWWHIKNIKTTLKKREIVQRNIRAVSDKKIFDKCLLNPQLIYYFLLYKYGVVNGLKKYKDKKLLPKILYKAGL